MRRACGLALAALISACALSLRAADFYSEPLDTQPAGWTTAGQWVFGVPQGMGSAVAGQYYADPTSGCTGTNVYGVNLAGDYSTAIGGPHWLTTAPINCTGKTDVHLKFARRLNSDYPNYVHAVVAVSNNGTTWTEVFHNQSGVTIYDSAWQQLDYNISSVADNQAAVRIRWGYQVSSSGAWSRSGWNIDDIRLAGDSAAADFYSESLNTQPAGWTTAGQWAFGVPQGMGSAAAGQYYADPTAGCTGTNVYGVNLAGDYSTAIGGPYWLTTAPINCTGKINVRLKFARRLNTDYPNYVHAVVAVSRDGTTWTEVFHNQSGVTIYDSAWQQLDYNISSVADNQAAVRIRWGYQVSSSGAWSRSGWNIDDIRLAGDSANAPPTDILLTNASVAENSPAATVGTLSAVDSTPGDMHTFTLQSDPSGTFEVAGTTLRLKAGVALNYEAVSSHSIQVKATDSAGSQFTKSFTITVTDVNEPPVISGTPGTSVLEDAVYSFTPTVTDPDAGDTRTFSIVNKPAWASFSTATGALSGAPANADVGTTAGIVITVADSANATASLPAFSLTVINVNDPPVVDDQTFTIAENSASASSVGTIIATDVDAGDTRTFTVTGGTGATAFSVAADTGQITVANSALLDFETTPSFTLNVTVADAGALTDTAVITVTLTDANDAPVISGLPPTRVRPNLTMSFTPTVTDQDGDVPFTFSIVNKPAWALFNTQTGTLSGTPSTSQTGTTSGIVITVTDAGGASSSLPAFDLAVVAGPIRFFVDAARAGTGGLVWSDALHDLQTALTRATVVGDEIWVAAGTYKPAAPGGPTSSKFQLKADVRVYGGFAGMETNMSERDWKTHPTILSGDLNGDDGQNVLSDNAVNVVTSPSVAGAGGAALDGFTITGANGSSGLRITAAMAVRNCTITENFASSNGGGLYISGGSPVVADCVLHSNTSGNYGGGIYVTSSTPVFVNCAVESNDTGFYGGGASLSSSGSVTFANCVISGNSAGFYGGGVYRATGATFTQCTIAGNSAPYGGGGLYRATNSSFANCVVWGNTPSNTSSCTGLSFDHCDVQGCGGSGVSWQTTLGTDNGGNIDSDPLFANAAQPSGPDGVFGTADDGLAPEAESPCFNAGDSGLLPADPADLDGDGDTGELLPLDVAGRPRAVGTAVDMGAYENPNSVRPAQATDDAWTTAEDTPLTVPAPGVQGNDRDESRRSLSAVVTTGPTHGTLQLSANGGFLYVPALNYNGSDSFQYVLTAAAGSGPSHPATVSLTITPVDDAPVVVNPIPAQTLALAASVSFSLAGVFADPEGDEITITVAQTGAPVVSAAIQGGNLVLTAGTIPGTVNVAVTAHANGLSAASRVSVTVGAPAAIGLTCPDNGRIVRKPETGDTVSLSFTMENLQSGDEIRVYDAAGNDITAGASIAWSGATAFVSVPLDTDAASQPGLASLGITAVVLRGGTPVFSKGLSLTVDAAPPVVTASIPGGRFVRPFSCPVLLSASEPGCNIRYSINGDSDPPQTVLGADAQADQINLTFAANTVLRFYAVDPAGNVGPVGVEFYAFAELPPPPELSSKAFVKTAAGMTGVWTSAGAGLRYHIYRATSPFDAMLLKESHSRVFPPPLGLRATVAPVADLAWCDTTITPTGVDIFYAVSSVDADNVEGAASGLAVVDLGNQTPAGNDVAEAVRRAVAWLESTQQLQGGWDSPGRQSGTATCAAVRGLSRSRAWRLVPRNASMIDRALAYLAGRTPADNAQFAEIIPVLDAFGLNTAGRRTALLARASTFTNEATTVSLGWAPSRRSHPDALCSAFGLLVFSRDLTPAPSTWDALLTMRTYVSGASLNVGNRTISGAGLRSGSGTTIGRYGWTPGAAAASPLVSAQVAAALGRNRHSSTNNYLSTWPSTWPWSSQSNGALAGSVTETAAALLLAPTTDTGKRNAARSFLAQAQLVNGSWNNDAWLTGLCLEALTAPRVLLAGDTLTASPWAAVLNARGFSVTELPVDAGDVDLIIVAGATNLDAIADAVRRVPMIVCAADCFQPLGLAPPPSEGQQTWGTANGAFVVLPDLPGCALAANFGQGSRCVYLDGSALAWATPGATALTVATVDGDPAKAALFAYEKGAWLPSAERAPARCVGCFVQPGTTPNDEARDLLDAAIQWTLGRRDF